LHAQADADLLFRAVANLLRNAIRYAGDAGPIHARAERDAGGVRISICDSGPGIPAEALPQIFDPFYRLDASRTRDTGGVGLGLTIAKTCVEACGGKITAANTSPAGLCVAITLQAAASPAHVASAAAANTLATRAPSVPAP
jgi:two-component system sensor histidine kinase CpxA